MQTVTVGERTEVWLRASGTIVAGDASGKETIARVRLDSGDSVTLPARLLGMREPYAGVYRRLRLWENCRLLDGRNEPCPIERPDQPQLWCDPCKAIVQADVRTLVEDA